MRTVLLAFCLILPVAACGGSKPAPTETPKPDTPTPAQAACTTFVECGPCVEGGCNWSSEAKSCAETCLQDVSCFGPGNPAAATCPATP